ncbi:MAG: 5'-methylthioadenosine/S-adenosylhomocysteine nucleosidase [Bacteroidales bacterium]|nr:5'-methylthioadenosine/S-adenosylhomocysteine nucleosidase [Bacteroidales bacterium]
MEIVVLVAMETEHRLFLKLLGENARLGRHHITLKRCGIGKVNAAVMAADVIRDVHPDLVISSGVAGSCSADVHTMDFVIGRETAYHDVWCGKEFAPGQVQGLPKRFRAPEEYVKAALDNADSAPGAVIPGLIASGDAFIEYKEEVQAILKKHPDALAVDMESAALAQTCYIKGVPFISVRLISDSDNDSRYSSYKDFWKTAGENSFAFIKRFIESL